MIEQSEPDLGWFIRPVPTEWGRKSPMESKDGNLNQPPPPEEDGRIELAPGVLVHPGVLEWSYTTSRGPGGQNVNKRETKAVLRVKVEDLGLSPGAVHRLSREASRWLVDEGRVLLMGCEEQRSQGRNREACLAQLRVVLIRVTRPPRIRKKTKPSRGAIERRLEAKRQRSEAKTRRNRLE